MTGENECRILGRLVDNPTVKASETGISTYFTIAVGSWSAKAKKEFVEYIPISAFGKTAEYIGNNAHKGDMVNVYARIHRRKHIENDVTTYEMFLNAYKFNILSRVSKNAEPDSVPEPPEIETAEDPQLFGC